MTIAIPNDLEKALNERAQSLGVSPANIVEQALRKELEAKSSVVLQPPKDDWERRLRNLGVKTGAALSDDQLSRENQYDE